MLWRCVLVLGLIAPVTVADEQGYKVTFRTGDPKKDSQLKPNFSPYGTQVKLSPSQQPKLAGKEHLTGRIGLGPANTRGEGQLVGIARSEAEKPYDLLFIDSNLDGSLEDEKAITITPRLNRNNWWSSFGATLTVAHDAKDQRWEYPVSVWVTVEDPKETPKILRYSRQGFLVGDVKVGETEYKLALADGNNDGVFGNGDFWTIIPAKSTERPAMEDWRKMPDFAWASEQAWKLKIDGTSGAHATLTKFNPGKTREEDEVSRDKYKEARDAPRAAKPVKFLTDYEAAMKLAAEKKMPIYLKFEADWCVPCKLMHTLVFPSQEVTDAANGVVLVVIDGDNRKDLKEKYKVSGYPAAVLLNSEGKELARQSGYVGVKAMTKFLQDAKK